jgi:hypothetical protein
MHSGMLSFTRSTHRSVTSILQEVMRALGCLSGRPTSVFRVKAKVGVAGTHFSVFVAFFRAFGLSSGNDKARGDAAGVVESI